MPTNYFVYFLCMLCLHTLVSSGVYGHKDAEKDHDESHHDDTSNHDEESDIENPDSSNATPNEEKGENLTSNDSENEADDDVMMQKEYFLDHLAKYENSENKIENKTSDGAVKNTTSEQGHISNTNNMNDTDMGDSINDNQNHQNDEANKSKGAGQTQNFNTANEGPRLDEYPTDDNEASAYETFYPDGRTKATPVDTNNSANDQKLNNTESKNDLDAKHENESTEKGEEDNDKSLNLMDSKFGKAFAHKMNENFLYREKLKNTESVNSPSKDNRAQKITSDPLKSNFTFILEAFDETVELILNLLKPIVIWPHVVITVQNRTGEKNISFSDLDDLNIYEGSLGSKKISYVCGFIVNDIFSGILIFENGTILHGEFSKHGNVLKHSHLHNRSDEEMESSHSHSCKREEEKIKCYESEKKSKRNILSFFGRSKFSDDSKDLFDESPHSQEPEETRSEENHADKSSCDVELVSDASHFVDEHKENVIETVREMLITTLQANHILNQVDLDKNEKPDNIGLKISHIILKASKEDEDGNSTDERQVMDKKIEEFQRRPQNNCMSILFISEKLTKDEPVTIAYAGGVCKCGEHENPAKNVAVINTKSSNNSNESLQTVSWRMTEVIGQLMGSLEEDCQHISNMSSDQDLTSSLSECRRENMKRTLALQGSCLDNDEKDTNTTIKETEKKPEKKEKQCGDGNVDDGEECDCGKDCKKKFSCCNSPGEAKQCTFNTTRGFKCDWTDPCCTMTCELVPKSWNKYCGKGDHPKCGPPNAICDGSSHKCSVAHYDVKQYNGRRCNLDSQRQIGSGTCKDGFCNSTVCKDNGLQDCICPHRSSHECKVCCMKDEKGGKCHPAERFGLKSDEGSYFLRDFGTPCKRQFNYHCNERGRCALRRQHLSVKKSEAVLHYSTFFSCKMSSVAFVLWNLYWKIFNYELL